MNFTSNELFRSKAKNSWLFALFVVLIVLDQFQFSVGLNSDSEFVIGEATKYGVDVAKRVRIFYFVIGSCLIGLITVKYIIDRFLGATLNSFTYIQPVKWLVITDVVLLSFSMITEQDLLSVHFLHAQLILLIIVELLNRKYPSVYKLTNERLIINMLIGLSLLSLTRNPFVVLPVQFTLFHILPHLRATMGRFAELILTSSAVVVILGVETSMIFNQHSITIPVTLTVLLYVILFAVTFSLLKLNRSDDHKLIYNVYTPLVIAGFILTGAYSPILAQPAEMFELANKLNPVMLMAEYGKLPMIDFISSHMLSDFFWESIYVFLNGYSSDAAPLIYSGFNHVIGVVIMYFFLRTMLGRKPSLIFYFIFSPYLFLVLPSTFAFILVPAIFLRKYEYTSKVKWLWFLGFSLLFLGIWRLDLAVAAISSALLLFLLLFIVEKEKRNHLVTVGLTFGIIGAVIIILYLLFLPDFTKQILGYFGANQAHGLHVLTYQKTNLFWLNYYILPAIIVALTAYLLVNIQRLRTNGGYWTLLFLIGLYVFNLQRGLVRHSFAELHEHYISSLGWFCMLFFIYQFGYRRMNLSKILIAFTLFGFFVSIHRADNWRSILDQTPDLKITELPALDKKIDRVQKNHEYYEKTAPLVEFLNAELTPEETFLDFSNSSLLYYYSGKYVPSVFCQFLQNTVTEELQEYSLKELEDLQIPIVVFNQVPRTFFDETDGIPNQVRYRKITAFIYNNYRPYKKVGSYQLWCLKSKRMESDTVDAELWTLGEIPYYWARHVSDELNKTGEAEVKPGSLLKIWIQSDRTQEVSLRSKPHDKFSVSFKVKEGRHAYILPLGSSYHIAELGLPYELELINGVEVVKVKTIED